MAGRFVPNISFGHPVVRIGLDDRYDQGPELVRWEVATATAGAVLSVNPLDEPNVPASKRNTGELLERWQRERGLGEGEPASREGELSAWTGAAGGEDASPPDLLQALWDGLSAGDYFAVLACLQQTHDRQDLLQRLRLLARDRQAMSPASGLLRGGAA
jgi:hypothetical protein